MNAYDLEMVYTYFRPAKTKRNQLLLSSGEVCRHYYFVNKGCIRIYTIQKDGRETSRYFAFEGNFGTALPSFIEQVPATEYMQTIERSELLSITREDFLHLIDTIPAFAFIYRQILELGFIMAQQRIYGFQGFDALEKVKWIIQHQPDFLLRVSNKMAASYLGISPSTLSRTKARL
ncbi:Crp/Fnr family transcriptional regulator [Pontibacter kalidii]|uniref:Crp/Fnr family transcriptional regulator n=1 Tax=Pontibacter kalidii TaxID=2592049 RepID=UPI002256E401|nr:Crp/Fnr family transcriptional regulator [Pontibacter kalidii]